MRNKLRENGWMDRIICPIHYNTYMLYYNTQKCSSMMPLVNKSIVNTKKA